MVEMVRSEAQRVVIDRAMAAGCDGLTADMYQDAVVAQVITDTPRAWPLGSIEGLPPSVYMANGAAEEYAETLERDKTNPGYHRMAKLILPSDVAYPFDEPCAANRHLKEFGDLSWYVANILAGHGVRLSSVLPAQNLLAADELARHDAQAYGGLAWRLPGHNYVSCATHFLRLLAEMDKPLPPGDVALFLQRRDKLAQGAGNLLLTISVVAQAKFAAGLAQVLYGNLSKIEQRAITGTTLYVSGDEREKLPA